MKVLSCIIVEDDKISRTIIENLCVKSNLILLEKSFDHATEAIEFLKTQPVDVVFLDIDLPDMKGWQMLEQLAYMPLVIVTTSYKEYAYEAFEYKVVDFIQKPIEQNQFDASLLKAIDLYTNKHVDSQENYIFIKSNGKFIRLLFDEILFVENIADYIKIHLEKKHYVIYCTLKYLQERLPTYFIKIHRSYIVNSKKIIEIEEDTVNVNNHSLPIARSQKKELFEFLNML